MRAIAWALLLMAAAATRQPARRVIEVSTADELMAAFREPLDNVTVKLAPGRYILTPREAEEQVRPCHESTNSLVVTVGLIVSGRGVCLMGPEVGEAVIATEADYRLYFRDCAGCEVERITITGEMSTSAHPVTGAAVLAKNSEVQVRNCAIRDNTAVAETPPRTVDGIVGLDGAMIEVEFNEISGNRVGVCLYDDAQGVVRNNLIEGFPLRSTAGGLALMVFCDAQMIAERNLMRDLGDGVQLAGSPSLELRANVIEDVRGNAVSSTTWGLGRVMIDRNVIYRCGGPGIAMRADGDQKATNNIIVETGKVNPMESAIQVWGARSDAAIRKNTLFDNTVADDSLDRDVPREIFWRARRKWTRTYRNTPVGIDGRHRFHESAFLTRYGRWLD